jgi:DNA-binding CsgD family transcriptional regulator
MTDHLFDPDEPRSLRRWLIAASLGIAGFCAVDLALDRPEHWLSFHVLLETAAALSALALATRLWLGWHRAERTVAELKQSLRERGAERDAWRSSAQVALDGLARAMDVQFSAWRLTPAEREVALLLLKGYSHKQVAQATGRGERTARQHAASVYHKAGLDSRAELAAYFLEDLMLPVVDRERGRGGAPR